ncbi:MAG TPA: hypothetical protein VIK01_16125 [Polyangiaceae bacterium]
MQTLRDILDLPEEVTKSAFVVRLAEAVHHPDALMATYAITPDIHAALDRGLGLVGNALHEQRNDAAFIHGSFGSGKSHFMAVLSLLAGNAERAWREPSLHDLLVKHEWVKEKKLFRLHLNMIDAVSLGDKLFGSYLELARKLHPEAPVAPLFADEALFANTETLRQTVGEEKFFAVLNQGASVDSRWGKKAEGWNAERFAQARISTDPKQRAALFSALVKTHFPAFTQQASAFLPFEQGMLAMARHVKDLGYDGIVLFLDELILWLATKASNREALNNEIGKFAKLVEGQAAEQAVPIVTFAAQQRDVREMVGDHLAGDDAEIVGNSLKFWQGRYNTIKLPDKDLPAIIEKRVVHPKNAEAKQTLDTAFDGMRRTLGQTAWGTLLGDIGDEQGFRRVYPFSPALVEVLVAMSHYLQRERTALKLLVEMLVHQLDDFEIGKLVPVGDLYDALAEGEEPMDGTMRERFSAAKRLYDSELLPLIQEQNQTDTPTKCQRLRSDAVTIGCANCGQTKCRNDNRIAKTLLLAALAPNTPVFRNLTASRVVKLNHGTLKTMVPGAEATIATQRIQSWAREVDKVRTVGAEDPRVWVELEGVDVKPILQAAGHYDTSGMRKAKLRELLFHALDIESEKNTIEEYKINWRNTDRFGTVHFGNVRDMDDSTLRAGENDEFRFIIDYPFDDPGRSPQEDEARLQRFLDNTPDTPTIVWLPSFLADSVQRDLGDLVVHDRILGGDNWKQHLSNLRPDDQTRAREGLTSKATQKRERLRRALDAAYGLQRAETGTLDPTRCVSQNFYVLKAGSKIRSVAAADLKRGMEMAIGQLLDDVYPRHPHFEDKVTRGKLDKELEMMSRLIEADGQRLPLTKSEAHALQFADKLGLVQVRDAQATLNAQLYDDLDRQLRAQNIDTPDVATVQRLFDPERVRGLTPEVADFVVLAYAAKTGREIVRGGQPLRNPVLGKMDKDAELLQPRLPSETEWHQAVRRAGVLFGISVGKARTPRNLRSLTDQLTAKVEAAKQNRAQDIAGLLARRAQFFEGEIEPPRVATAQRVASLLGDLSGADAVRQVQVLAELVPQTSEAAMQRHIVTARAVSEVLASEVPFASFPALNGMSDPAAQNTWRELRDVFVADELQRTFASTVNELSVRAQQIVHGAKRPEPPITTTQQSLAVKSGPDLEALVEKLRSAMREGELLVSWRRKP